MVLSQLVPDCGSFAGAFHGQVVVCVGHQQQRSARRASARTSIRISNTAPSGAAHTQPSNRRGVGHSIARVTSSTRSIQRRAQEGQAGRTATTSTSTSTATCTKRTTGESWREACCIVVTLQVKSLLYNAQHFSLHTKSINKAKIREVAIATPFDFLFN